MDDAVDSSLDIRIAPHARAQLNHLYVPLWAESNSVRQENALVKPPPAMGAGSDPELAVTPIGHLARGCCTLEIWCRSCDRRRWVPAQALARQYRHLALWEATARMRCGQCGQRGVPIRVTDWPPSGQPAAKDRVKAFQGTLIG